MNRCLREPELFVCLCSNSAIGKNCCRASQNEYNNTSPGERFSKAEKQRQNQANHVTVICRDIVPDTKASLGANSGPNRGQQGPTFSGGHQYRNLGFRLPVVISEHVFRPNNRLNKQKVKQNLASEQKLRSNLALASSEHNGGSGRRSPPTKVGGSGGGAPQQNV